MGSGRVRVLCIPDPNPTRIYNIKKKKKKKKNPSINTNFPNPKSLTPIHSHSVLPSRFPFSPSLHSHSHKTVVAHFAGAAFLACLTSPTPLHSPPRRLSSLPPSPSRAAFRRRCSSLTSPGPLPPQKAATLSSPSPRGELKILQ